MSNSILCEILTGSQAGTMHIISRIEMEPNDSKWPFEFKRVQFPFHLCFAMTINKSQGQSPDIVGFYLPRSVFTHGQLYVVVSRVTSPSGLHILTDSDSTIIITLLQMLFLKKFSTIHPLTNLGVKRFFMVEICSKTYDIFFDIFQSLIKLIELLF